MNIKSDNPERDFPEDFDQENGKFSISDAEELKSKREKYFKP